MLHFYFKLIPSRPTFSQDMNAAERAIMNDHITYFTTLFDEGKVVLFGPVLDPKGAYGLSILETATEDEAKAIAENDPSVKNDINTYELLPLYLGRVRAK